MTILFVFFVLPLATILLAIVLQKILRNPILVGITFFAIFLIVAFVAFADNLAAAIIGAIILSIIAFITAIIVQLICILRQRFGNNCCRCKERRCCRDDDNNEVQTISDTGNLLRISCSCQNGESSDLLTINSNSNCNNNNDNNCGCDNINNDLNVANVINSNNGCGCKNNTQNGVAVTANIVPNNNNGGRRGYIRGFYRRF